MKKAGRRGLSVGAAESCGQPKAAMVERRTWPGLGVAQPHLRYGPTFFCNTATNSGCMKR